MVAVRVGQLESCGRGWSLVPAQELAVINIESMHLLSMFARLLAWIFWLWKALMSSLQLRPQKRPAALPWSERLKLIEKVIASHVSAAMTVKARRRARLTALRQQTVTNACVHLCLCIWSFQCISVSLLFKSWM